LTKDDERKLMISERKMLRNINGLEVNHKTNTYERVRNEELQKLYNRPNIIGINNYSGSDTLEEQMGNK